MQYVKFALVMFVAVGNFLGPFVTFMLGINNIFLRAVLERDPNWS